MDSNHDTQIQNLQCYRYTTRHQDSWILLVGPEFFNCGDYCCWACCWKWARTASAVWRWVRAEESMRRVAASR